MDKIIENFQNKFMTNKKMLITVFATTFIVMMAINGFFFTGFSLGHDSYDVVTFEKEIYTKIRITQGRFLSDFINTYFLSALNMPFLTGICECVFMSVTCFLILKMLGIESQLYSIIISAIISSSVSIISINCFIQEGIVNILGILVCVLSVYVLAKNKLWSYIVGTLLLGLSINFYQAHFGNAFALCSLVLYKHILKNNLKLREIISVTVKLLLSLAIAMLIYIAGWEIALSISGLSKSSYKGMNSLGISSLLRTPFLILPTYSYTIKELFKFGFKSYIPSYITLMNIIAFVFAMYFALKKLINIAKQNKNYLQIVCFAILTLSLPVIIFINYIISFTTADTLPVKFSFIVFPILITWILHRYSNRLGTIVSVVFASLIFINSFYGGNITSTKRVADYEQGLAFANQMINRIYSEPGYTLDKKVVFVGGYPQTKPYSRQYYWCDDVQGANLDQAMSGTFTTMAFIKRLSPLMKVYQNEEKYMRDENVVKLDLFPAQNCMTVVDDVYVIRLANW